MRLKPDSPQKWMIDINQDLCIAKTEKMEGIVSAGMNVTQHCIAAGRVAEVLSKQFPYFFKIGMFPEGFKLIVSLHDIGKISPSFQFKIANALNTDQKNILISSLGLEGYSGRDSVDIPHGVISYSALKEVLGKFIAYIEGAHHGWLQDDKYSPSAEIFGGAEWQVARLRFLEEMKGVWGSAVPVLSDSDYPLIQFLLGLTIVSDWISSSISLSELYDDSVFMHSVEKSGFRNHRYRSGLSFDEIFGFSIRSEQQAFIDSVKGPGVYILEAGTGSGKTEAALYAAYKLLSSGNAEGIYFALPTTLTSRHIQKRVDRFLNIVLEDENFSSKLVFGNSFLYNCAFSDSFPAPSWFDSRKRLILAPFGVGTIDQALMSVISVKHSAVRTFGLAGKVVILDEVHSYDNYTGLLIDELVKQLRSLGATVIILSATLQTSVRKNLICATEPAVVSDLYPSVTINCGNGIYEVPISGVPDKVISIMHEINRNDAIDNAIDDAFDGKYVLWIENTVAEAQSVYRKIATRCEGEVPVGLLHSRLLGSDRRKKESEYTALFGKESWKERQSGNGFILVGTQVLEQSLDIDADVLYTNIAPIDMIFQRIGRLWRHEHPDRKGRPVCHLIHPSIEEIQEDPDVLGPTGAVYSGYILYRTIKALDKCENIKIPSEIRYKLNEVYDETDENDIKINKLKSDLISKTKKLRNLAFRSLSKVGTVLSDTALPRYSELRHIRIMIISRIDLAEKKVWLCDGACIDFSIASSPQEKARIALSLEESIINVPERYCGKVARSDSLDALLSKYIYNGDDDFSVMLKGEGRQLTDIFGNPQNNFFYDENLGYYVIKEGFIV